MLGFTVKGRFDVRGIEEKLEKAKKLALTATARSLAKEAEPYVRFQSGATAMSVNRSDFANGHVTYDTPYARYIYYNEGAGVNRSKHPLACIRWAEVAWEAKKDRIMAVFDKVLVEGMKNE